LILKMCLTCREKSGNWHLRKWRRAEEQGAYMHPQNLEICYLVIILTMDYWRTTMVYFR
jgi:hypothetical protein